MIVIRGVYYDGRTSQGVDASLDIYGNGEARLTHSGHSLVLRLSTLRISTRVGNTPRCIGFPDGAEFHSEDNDAIDRLLARRRVQRGGRLLHLLETKWGYVLTALVAVVVLSWGFVQYGVPLVAKHAAFALPAQTNLMISQGTLDLVEKTLGPSGLEAAVQSRIAADFAAMTRDLEPGFHYQLLFRKGNRIGANALALPSGTVIITDEMVMLARHEHEIVAVLAHELGHVRHRHGLRQVIQDAVIVLGLAVVVGDASSLIATVPAMLVEAGYSRDLEREADAYALDYLRRHDIDPVHFKNLMTRLQGPHGEVPAYISTHPPTSERVRAFAEASRQKAPRHPATTPAP